MKGLSMKRLLALLLLAASPLLAQPSRYSLATQIQPGFASTALGDTYYATGSTGSASAFGRIAPNTTSTRKFWMQASSAISWVQLVSGDIPTLNQDTTGKAAKADALSTTGAAVNVAAAAAPTGSGKTLITTDATHATWQTAAGGGAISSINADTTAAQVIAAGTGISVGTVSGTTTITNTGATGVPVGLVQIAQIVTSASQATVDFTSIPAGYNDLLLVLVAQGATADLTGYIKLNNDGTAGNYFEQQWLNANTASVTTGQNSPTTNGVVFAVIGGATAGGSNATSTPSVVKIMFPGAANTTFFKRWMGEGGEPRGANTHAWLDVSTGMWKSTAPITRITLTFTGGNLLAGSVATLYGTVTGGASTVVLQPTTPGTAQTGNSNITGTATAGAFVGPADANTLSNTTLKSTVVNSSLTSVGTLPVLIVSDYIRSASGTRGILQAYDVAGSAYRLQQFDALSYDFMLGGASKMVMDGSGNVVVGSATALTKLSVSSPTDVPDTVPALGTAGGRFSVLNNNDYGLLVGVLNTGNVFQQVQRTDATATAYHLVLQPSGGNVGIGSSTFGTSAATVLGIGNGTAPSTSPANMVQLWAEDVSSSSELRVRDEAGNVTTLSPHNFSLFTPAATQAFPWSYYSKNAHIGKEINVDMYGAIAEIEKLSGKKFIYVNDLPADQIEDWTAQEAAKKITVEKARLDKAMAVEVEVAAKDAAESVAVMETRASKTLTETVTTYALDAASGAVKPVVTTKPKSEQVATGKTEYRLRTGIRLDEKTGRFWRHVRADEAVVEPYVPKAPPAWIAERMAKK
jgi:hypothetical protein